MRNVILRIQCHVLARKCPAVCLVFGISSATASSSVLGSTLATATISTDWPEGEGERERKGERREERRLRGDGFWDSIPWLRWK